MLPLIIYLIGYVTALLMLRDFAVARNAKGKLRREDYVIIMVLSIGSWLWGVLVFVAWLYRISKENP